MNEVTKVVVFTKVVEANSLTGAANLLDLSPSAVSRQISQLETELGVRLLNRTTRKLSLTDVGAEFYALCSRGLSCLDEAMVMAARYRETPLGRLRVSASQGFGRHYVAKLMPDFLKRYPGIQVELACGRLQRTAFENDWDVMIQSFDLNDANLSSRDLMQVERITCATPAYLAQHGMPKTFNDLRDHNCLVFADHPTVGEWRYRTPKGEIAVSVRGNFETDSAEAYYEGVMSGIGIARLPSYLIAEELRSGALCPIFRQIWADGGGSKPRPYMMKAFSLKSKYQLPRVAVFMEYLVEKFKEMPELASLAAPAKGRKRGR